MDHDHVPSKLQQLSIILEDFTKDDFKKQITFQEFLIVARVEDNETSDTPTPIGGLCLNIQYAVGDTSKIVVYARSQFNVDGRKAGSRLTTWLDKHLHTIEEKRVEWINPGEQNEPALRAGLYTSLQKDYMYVRRSNSWEPPAKARYPLEIHKKLVNEGASFALMRLLAVTRHIGQFETLTMYINGSICRNIYFCMGPESGMVNQKKMDVCHIYRKVVESCGITHICKTTLTTTGRIIQHEWEDCDYVFHINPLYEIDAEDGSVAQEKLNTCKDLELLSIYLDRKDLSMSQLKSYLSDRADIKNILADYVQTVLQMKPDDVLQFTIEYFSRYNCTT